MKVIERLLKEYYDEMYEASEDTHYLDNNERIATEDQITREYAEKIEEKLLP